MSPAERTSMQDTGPSLSRRFLSSRFVRTTALLIACFGLPWLIVEAGARNHVWHHATSIGIRWLSLALMSLATSIFLYAVHQRYFSTPSRRARRIGTTVAWIASLGIPCLLIEVGERSQVWYHATSTAMLWIPLVLISLGTVVYLTAKYSWNFSARH